MRWLLILAIAFQTQCGPRTMVAGKAFIACENANIWQVVKEQSLPLYVAVIRYLASGEQGWDSQLEKLIVKFGNDSVACAAYAYELSYTAGVSTLRTNFLVVDRTAQFIQSKGWNFK